MRARFASRCRSTRGPTGGGSQVETEAVPQITTRAPCFRCFSTVSLMAPAVLSK
jgi:hypothetical protein